MKPLYTEEPDQDDILLERAIADGIVPPRCRLGGAIVQGIAAAKGDPCMTCDVDREQCGGRPKLKTPSHPIDTQLNQGFEPGRLNDGTTARRQGRRLTITQLNRMIREKKDENT